MKNSVFNFGSGAVVKMFKALCLVVAFVTGLCGDVWGAEYYVYESGGSWDSRNNWWIVDGNRMYLGISYPSTANDNAIIDENCTITVRNNSPSIGMLTIWTGTVTVNSGRTLTLNSGLTYNGGTIGGNGNITIKGSLIVNADLTIGDKFNITGVTNIEVADGATLTINKTTLSFANLVSVSGNVVINGNEELTINSLTKCTGGNFTFNATNVVYSATCTKILPGIYNNLTINSSNNVSLCGDVEVNGLLKWDAKNIVLNHNSFILNKSAEIESDNGFSDTHMFAFSDSSTAGFLTIKGDLSRVNGGLLPVGSIKGTTPTDRFMTIDPIPTSDDCSFSVRLTNRSGTGRGTDMKYHWTTESENISDATLIFNYNPNTDLDDIPASAVLKPFCDPGSDWEKWIKDGSVLDKVNNQLIFTSCTPTGRWTACEDIISFYSYGNGNWNNANIWTLDPSGTIYKNPEGLVPTAADRVVILGGNEVRTEANGKGCISLTINDGGVLSIETTTGHNFGQVKGKGKLVLASTNFPGGDYSIFVKKNGGIVEYQNVDDFILPPTRKIYNNLIINIPNDKKAILGSSFKVNGYLTIESGIFQIGDNSGKGWSILIEDDVTVERNGQITTSSTEVDEWDQSLIEHRYYDVDRDIMGHYMVINGDFINNGEVRFTNLDPASAPAQYGIMPNNDYPGSARDHVDVFFKNQTKDQNIVINGLTYFYMIDVDKGGVDQCVNVSASAENQFYLLGYLWNFPENIDGSVHADQYNKYYHALRLSKGTIRLGENIKIDALQYPEHSNGNGIDYNSYLIPETGCLWIDGADVTIGYEHGNQKTTTFAVYGKLKITNSKSKLKTNCTNGIIWREYGVIEIEDGELDTQSINTSTGTGGVDHRGSFVMRGGTINLHDKSEFVKLPVFGMTHPTMSFNMSDGEVNITTNNIANVALAIGINEHNATITGGTFNIITNGANSTLTSTLPFYNLSIQGQNNRQTSVARYDKPTGPRDGGEGTNSVGVYPLVVQNNLSIENVGHLNANGNDVTIGGDFSIASGNQYTPGTNTTTFNGTARTVEFTAAGTINGNGLNNLTIDEGTSLVLNNEVTVRSNLSLKANSTFVDNGNTLSVSGNIENSGTQYNSGAAAGSITLTGTGNQTISGNGEGAFNNLYINKTGGSVTLSADIKVTGALRMLSDHNLNIGSYNLNLDDNDAAIYSDASTGANFSNTKMIVTSGLSSDGGITKRYSSTQPFLFPYGYGTYYLPASIQVANNPTAFGSVTSRPVNGIHFAFETNAVALKCYWHNTSSGFEGVTDILHKYTYVDAVVNGTEDLYMPGCYNMSSWEYITNSSLVDKGNNQITYPDVKIDGDYTCGTEAALTHSPQTLYSATALGNWEDASSWSAIGVGEAGGGNGVPGAGTIVYIGDESHSHTIRMSNNIEHKSGVLCIAKKSTLDLVATNRNNFGMVLGEANGGGGTIRLSSNNFPGGDFGEFLRAGGGTIEYYTNGGDIAIPASPTTYNNLEITANGNNYCTLPNVDLHVFGDLTSNGGNNNYNRFNTGSNTRTLTIDGNLKIATGILNFQSSTTRSGNGWVGYTYTNYPQNVIVKGNVKVGNDASFGVKNSNYNQNFANQITIYGNMVSDGTISFAPDNYQKVATTFTGTANDTIKGNGTISLYTLTCDKGTDATPVLYIEKNITTSTNDVFLDLRNGTFRANGEGVNINLTGDHDFTVPATACLSAQKGTFTVCNSPNDNAKLILNGKLEVLEEGTINVGSTTNNAGNDIEYNTATIDVSGNGHLNVSGQIRRAITLQTGDLTYIQSGGTVSIYGYNRDCNYNGSQYILNLTQNRRAIFEVCNNGAFITSGGELRIMDNAQGEGWSEYGFGDVLITPATFNVSGGTIVIGGENASPGQEFLFNSSGNIFNLAIGTASVGQIVKLQVNPLNLLGTLTINNGSTLNAVGHNVFVKGDIYDYSTNGYSASDGQCLTLNGTSLQRITGTGSNNIRVNKITFDNPTKVELSGIDIIADNYLHIVRGTVDDGGNLIRTKSDVINDSYHISSGDNGGIQTEGTLQTLRSSSGCIGNYDNLIIKSRTSATDNFQVNGTLKLEDVLNIGSIQLIMGPEASVDGTFNINSMILLTGAIGDLGVKKLLTCGSKDTILIPIGRTGIYSPAVYEINNISGTDPYIVVKVIGYRHKSMKEVPVGSVDMYWMVSSGGIEGGTVTHKYKYDDEDLKDGTDESKMLAKRYLASENEWENYDESESRILNDTIIINNLSYVDGEYTAGYYGYSCQPPMRSRITGPWNLSSTWEELVDKATDTWALTNSTPNGNPVTITSGTTVTVGEDSHAAYSTDIEGVLNIGNTSKHNFGRVRGSGTLELKALESAGDMQSTFKLPAGDYEEFLADANSTIIFDNGDRNAWLGEQPGNLYKPFSNVEFKGEGKTTVTAQAFSARGDVTIIDGCQIDNATNNRPFYVGGNYTDQNTSKTGYIKGSSKVIFCGTQPQTVTLGYDASFYDMEINNSAGVSVFGNDIDVSNKLYLTDGVIHTTAAALVRLSSTNQNVVTGGSATSHIDGPMSKNVLNSGSFAFPVGNYGRYGQITISNTAGTGYWTAQYFNTDPSVLGTTCAPPVETICDNEYWTVGRPAGATAKIGLRWDAESTPYTDIDMMLNRMRIVEYGNSIWTALESDAAGTLASGTITTKTNVTQDDYKFTFGYTGVVADITNDRDIEICGDGQDVAEVNVSLSGTAPWTLSYRVSDGTTSFERTQSGILLSPYTISLLSTDLGDAGNYTVSLVSVSDATSDGVTTEHTASIVLKQTYIPVIIGPQAVVRGETITYSVESHPGSTYKWTFPAGGSISGSSTNSSVTINFSNNNGERTLSVEETYSGCKVTSYLTITVSDNPAPDFDANLNVCVGDTIIYSTEKVNGHTYQWAVGTPNASNISGATDNSLKYIWTTTGTYKLRVTESKRVGGRTYSGYKEKTITVHPKPAVQTIAKIDEICAGDKPIVTLNGSEQGVSYYLYSGDNAISSLVSGTGSTINLTTLDALTQSTEIYVAATNLGCNFEQNNYRRIPAQNASPNTVGITVYPSPAITYTMPALYIDAPSILDYEVEANGAVLDNYSIDYTTGGVDAAGNLPDANIEFKPTASHIAGTLTIASEDGCSTSYDFDADASDGYVWKGSESNAWENPENWYSGAIPTNGHDAVIRNGNYLPVISNAAEAKSVKIESGVLTISGANRLDVYGDWQNEVGNAGFVGSESTVAFNNDAEISGNTTFGSISIENGNTVNISNGYIVVEGSIANAGTLSGSNGTTLELGGTTDGATLTGGTYNLANLTINKTAGITSSADLNVSGVLTLNAGVIYMGDYKINLGANASATSSDPSAYVEGTMTKKGASAVTFPIGNGRRAMIGIAPSGAPVSSVYTASYRYTPDGEPKTNRADALARVSGLECWDVTGTAPSSLTLHWDSGTESEINNMAALVVAHLTGGKWELVNIASRSGSPESGSITTAVVNSYSPFTFGSTEFEVNPLPVEVVDFTGHQDGKAVMLEWTTLSEKDNDYFEIERSTDGENFVTLGRVEGAGNSTIRLEYSFADNEPVQGRAYYRLSQVDYDGTRSYADRLVSVAYTLGSDISLTIVPNPTRGQFNVLVIGATDGVAKLLTQSGTLVRVVDIHSFDESIDISDLPNGIYILQYQTGEKVVHERIIKL